MGGLGPYIGVRDPQVGVRGPQVGSQGPQVEVGGPQMGSLGPMWGVEGTEVTTPGGGEVSASLVCRGRGLVDSSKREGFVRDGVHEDGKGTSLNVYIIYTLISFRLYIK